MELPLFLCHLRLDKRKWRIFEMKPEIEEMSVISKEYPRKEKLRSWKMKVFDVSIVQNAQ